MSLFGLTVTIAASAFGTPNPACTAGPATMSPACAVTSSTAPRNVLGGALETCSLDPITGFYRDGRCETGPGDRGVHVVCAVMTDAFLRFSRSRGNDLVTPAPRYRFAGLKPGQRWCLCAARFAEAARADVAPPGVLAATHRVALRTVSLETLQRAQVTPGGEGGAVAGAHARPRSANGDEGSSGRGQDTRATH